MEVLEASRKLCEHSVTSHLLSHQYHLSDVTAPALVAFGNACLSTVLRLKIPLIQSLCAINDDYSVGGLSILCAKWRSAELLLCANPRPAMEGISWRFACR